MLETLLESIDCLVSSLGKKAEANDTITAAMEMNNKTSPKIIFLAKTLKSLFYQYLEVKILKNIRVDVLRKKMMLNQILKTLKVMVFPKILVGPDY